MITVIEEMLAQRNDVIFYRYGPENGSYEGLTVIRSDDPTDEDLAYQDWIYQNYLPEEFDRMILDITCKRDGDVFLKSTLYYSHNGTMIRSTTKEQLDPNEDDVCRAIELMLSKRVRPDGDLFIYQ